jgi:uncharacterized protein (UPF0261 family)
MSPKIMVVDDSALSRRTMRRVLEAAGYEVLVFHATGAGGQTMESLIADGRGMSDTYQGVTLEVFGEGDNPADIGLDGPRRIVAQAALPAAAHRRRADVADIGRRQYQTPELAPGTNGHA